MPKKNRLKHDTPMEQIVAQQGVIYTTSELAAILKTSRESLAVRRHHGRLPIPVIRDGGRDLFRGEDILSYLAARTDASGGTRRQSKRLPSPGRPRLRRKAA
jgi:hypothetical protein